MMIKLLHDIRQSISHAQNLIMILSIISSKTWKHFVSRSQHRMTRIPDPKLDQIHWTLSNLLLFLFLLYREILFLWHLFSSRSYSVSVWLFIFNFFKLHIPLYAVKVAILFIILLFFKPYPLKYSPIDLHFTEINTFHCERKWRVKAYFYFVGVFFCSQFDFIWKAKSFRNIE